MEKKMLHVVLWSEQKGRVCKCEKQVQIILHRVQKDHILNLTFSLTD